MHGLLTARKWPVHPESAIALFWGGVQLGGKLFLLGVKELVWLHPGVAAPTCQTVLSLFFSLPPMGLLRVALV